LKSGYSRKENKGARIRTTRGNQEARQLSERIKEREHEETREKINELLERVKVPGQNDNGAWRTSM